MNHRASGVFSDRLPLTLQVAQILRSKVASGELAPGGRIAPELKLAEEFGVSVITIQRALRELEREGLITRHRGRGTFVKPSLPVVRTAPSTDVLSEMFMDQFGKDTRVLSRETIDRPAFLADTFPDCRELMLAKRVVFRDGKPWNHAVVYMPPDIGERIPLSKLKRYPAFRLVRDLGVELKDVDMNLQAAIPLPEVAMLLAINPLEPILLFKGNLRDKADRTVVLIELSFPWNRYTFRFNMDLRQKKQASARR